MVNCTFGGNSLQTFDGTHGIIVQNVLHAGKNAKTAQSYALSHANKSVIPFVEYPSKPITVSGEIVGSNIADLDSLIDTFNSYLTASSAALCFDYNGGSLNRQYIATATNIDVDRPGNLAWATFQILFTSTLPFGSDTSATTPTLSPSGTGRTLAAYTDAITFGGSAPIQLPIINYTVTDCSTGQANLVSNPGFETDTSTWNVSSGTLTRVTTQFHSGAASGQMVNGTTAIGGFFGQAYVNVNSATSAYYEASVWVKGNVGGELISFGLNSGVVYATATATTSWQLLKFSFQAQATLNGIMVASTSSGATWFIDDMTVVGYGGGTVTIGNQATGSAITVTRTWNPGDVLVIDTTQNTVIVNNQPVNFSGAFPVFAPGSQNLTYNDNFLSRTFNYSVSYTKQFI